MTSRRPWSAVTLANGQNRRGPKPAKNRPLTASYTICSSQVARQQQMAPASPAAEKDVNVAF